MVFTFVRKSVDYTIADLVLCAMVLLLLLFSDLESNAVVDGGA